MMQAFQIIRSIIDSLQQEQPCDTCTNDKGCVTCKDGELWEGKEQPCEELEAEIERVLEDLSFRATINSGGFTTTVLDYPKIAKHFYELGKGSQPQLPATLDEAAEEYERSRGIVEVSDNEDCRRAFKAGAEWQKQQKGENVSASTMIPSCWTEKQKEQKPQWTEEDERILKGVMGLIDHDQHYGVSNKEMLTWLKSLPEKLGKPAEPSCQACANSYYGGCEICVNKSQWEGKPQEELTEFEYQFWRCLRQASNAKCDDDIDKIVRANAQGLLDLALEQVEKELKETIGSDNKMEAAYALGCCDTREQLMREIKDENAALGSIRNPIDYQNEHFQKGVADGRRLEREDLPKWRIMPIGYEIRPYNICTIAVDVIDADGKCCGQIERTVLQRGNEYLFIDDLEKLPKEEEV